MTIEKYISFGLTVCLASLAGAGDAHSQQTFETRHVLAPQSPTELAPLPGIFIMPTGAVPLDADTAAQLSESVQAQLASAQETRFEVRTAMSSDRILWSFVVRNAPRAVHDVLTEQFTDQLIDCLHSIEDGVNLAALALLLDGGFLSDPSDRNGANMAGRQMLANWRTEQCAVRRNDVLFDRDSATLRGATRGMLTGAFDSLLFRGQGLLDLIAAITPLYLHAGGFWSAEMRPRLEGLFAAGVGNGLLTAAETPALVNAQQRTFWDWAILAVSTKAGLARSFIQSTATGCIAEVSELSKNFRLSSCLTEGRLQLMTLQVNGENYTTAQRRP